MAYLAGIVDGDGGIYFAPKNVGGVGTIIVVAACAWTWPELRRFGRLDSEARAT